MKQGYFPRTRGGWWPCEELVLIKMVEEGHKVAFIAQVLDRERMGVHIKIKIMQKRAAA